jgi:hypothetical protein
LPFGNAGLTAANFQLVDRQRTLAGGNFQWVGGNGALASANVDAASFNLNEPLGNGENHVCQTGGKLGKATGRVSNPSQTASSATGNSNGRTARIRRGRRIRRNLSREPRRVLEVPERRRCRNNYQSARDTNHYHHGSTIRQNRPCQIRLKELRRLVFGKDLYYLLIALAFGAATLLLIPKPQYKKFFIYGFLFGGAVNVLIILVLSGVFHLFEYRYLGVGDIWGLFSFFTPLTFMFIIMIYLYFLPVRKVFLYPYIAGFIVFAYMFGQPLKGLGLFKFYKNYQYFEPITFIVWFVLTAWVYIKRERITVQ